MDTVASKEGLNYDTDHVVRMYVLMRNRADARSKNMATEESSTIPKHYYRYQESKIWSPFLLLKVNNNVWLVSKLQSLNRTLFGFTYHQNSRNVSPPRQSLASGCSEFLFMFLSADWTLYPSHVSCTWYHWACFSRLYLRLYFLVLPSHRHDLIIIHDVSPTSIKIALHSRRGIIGHRITCSFSRHIYHKKYPCLRKMTVSQLHPTYNRVRGGRPRDRDREYLGVSDEIRRPRTYTSPLKISTWRPRYSTYTCRTDRNRH